MDIFWGPSLYFRLYLGVISVHFRVFFKVKVQNGGIFGGLLTFQIYIYIFLKFLLCVFFFFFFLGGGGGGGVNGRCWARAYV